MLTRRFGWLLALLLSPGIAGAAELAGSPRSMIHQHAVAVEEAYTFLRTPLDVEHLVQQGKLVPVTSSAGVQLAGVSFPYTRPEVLSFIEHFAAEYHDSTGATLVVTSLTRPEALQPRNAHALSVHPAGMAVDFRVPGTAEERLFLERALLGFETKSLIDVTREHTPPHYHVAVFPDAWHAYAVVLDSAHAADSARLSAARAPRATQTSLLPSVIPSDDSTAGDWLLGVFALLGTVAVPMVRRARRHV